MPPRHQRAALEDALPFLLFAAFLAVLFTAAPPAHAVSLGEMADTAAQDLDQVPLLISIAFYIIGIVIVGVGLLKLKKHVDQPQQTTLSSGLFALLLGTGLILAPSVIEAIGDTFGATGTAAVTPPTLQ